MKLNILFIIIFTQIIIAQNYWVPLKEMDSTQINSIAIDTNGFIFASGPYGTYRSTDDGNKWLKVRDGYVQNNNLAIAIKKENNFIFLGTEGQGMNRSTNKGDDWEPINNGFPWQYVDAVCINENGDVYFSGIDGIFKSTNNGDLWTSVGLIKQNHRSLLSNKDGFIYAGIAKVDSSEAVVYRSTDNGSTWEKSDNGIDIHTVYSLTENVNGDLYAGGYRAVYRSTDKGVTWQKTNLGAINADIYDLKANKNGDVFAAAWGGGVFITTDDGLNWNKINSGLSNLNCNSLAINPNGFVFVSSFEGGIFKSSETTTSIIEESNTLVNSYYLYQNYPNPFNPSTTISFYIPQTDHVKLIVYDAQGKEIETLINNILPSGFHEINYNGSKLTSGVYFYRIITSEFTKTKKFILIK
jgi:photosystem II stability/assembly factor-like uncharacterized protein